MSREPQQTRPWAASTNTSGTKFTIEFSKLFFTVWGQLLTEKWRNGRYLQRSART